MHHHHVLHISLLSNNQQCTAWAPRTNFHFNLQSRMAFTPYCWSCSLKDVVLKRGNVGSQHSDLCVCALRLRDGAFTRKPSLIRHAHTHISTHAPTWKEYWGLESCPKNQDNPGLRMGTVMERIIMKNKEERKVKAVPFLSIQSPLKYTSLEFA